MGKERIEGIILAAGFSRRTGEFKMGLDIFGKPALRRVADEMLKICQRVIVVGGFRLEEIKNILDEYDGRVEIVYNRNFEKGMFSSFITGVRQINADRFFMIPGDMPFVSEKVYRKLLAAGASIAIPVYEERKGHPVLLSGELIPELLKLPEEAILRDFINSRSFEVVEVEEEGILQDIDTPGDYYALLEQYKNSYFSKG
jgi:molybdenum cofactor cytidylyltransferase